MTKSPKSRNQPFWKKVDRFNRDGSISNTPCFCMFLTPKFCTPSSHFGVFFVFFMRGYWRVYKGEIWGGGLIWCFSWLVNQNFDNLSCRISNHWFFDPKNTPKTPLFAKSFSKKQALFMTRKSWNLKFFVSRNENLRSERGVSQYLAKELKFLTPKFRRSDEVNWIG